MLDQLMEIVQQQAQAPVVNNDAVPNEYNNAVMQEAGRSIFTGLQKMLDGGNANELASALKGDDITENQPVMNMLSGDFIDNITSKFGIDKSAASGIASSLIPIVLNKLVNKAKDPNDGSIDFGNILSSLQGSNSGNSNITSTISSVGSMLGFDKDKDGDVDLGDVFKMF